VTTATTYRTVVSHARRAPLRHRFRYHASAWLVDLDDLPQLARPLRWLARFDAADHLGDPEATIRENLVALLAAHGIDAADSRLLMLANARALGHAFNPISVHWCIAPDDTVQAVVAEVHNTYGDRHAYVLHPGATADIDCRLEKQMYVSPFNPVEGEYRITVSPPGENVAVTVTLSRPGQPPFTASLRGARRAPTSVVRAAMTTAAGSIRVTTLIRWQGVRLFVRGLHVEPRPTHVRQEAV
jgi:uncharacterized protein